MRSPFAVLQSLTIPAGAGSTSPGITIGLQPVPPELVAFYAADPWSVFTVVQGMIYRKDATHYGYEVLLTDSTPTPVRASGYVDGGVVWETSRTTMTGFPFTVTGVRNFTSTWVEANSELVLFGTLGLAAPGSLQITDDAGFVVDNLSAPRGTRGANLCTAGTVATSGASEVAIPAASWADEPTYDFLAGRLYKMTVNLAVLLSASSDSCTFVRVRKGSASTSGTQLGIWSIDSASSAGTNGDSRTLVGWFRNSTGATVSTKLSVTNERKTGAANTSLYGDSSFRLQLVIEDVGIASEQTGLTGVPSV